MIRCCLSVMLAMLLVACSPSEPKKVALTQESKKLVLPVPMNDPKAILGSQLFFDASLSKQGNQSCATCHDVGKAFTDPRLDAFNGAVSLGSDGVSMGTRNTPTAGYAALTPLFHQMADGEYRGGQFHDGRSSTLAEQAQGPFVNPVEMALPDGAAVVNKVKANPIYLDQFEDLYGEGALDKPEAYEVVADAIARFEQTSLFMPFDSRYDRALRGEIKLTEQEELGKTLFFSQQFTNCNACHQLNSSPFFDKETFSNYQYRNIGVPSNQTLLAHNPGFVDQGLLDHPAVNDPAQLGKFKVPTLRNVAVTGPYMHNGVFQDLRTVVLFYDKYNNPKRLINPETGEPWGQPEVAANIDLESLEIGPALNDQRVDAIVAFLKTLTDQRYEHLLEKKP
ncbi:cytochrome-c peroxidase [Marinomonas epiphytica]